ncbi:hypothetical protein QN277_023097 [Acacia crassicarpa]|uniref:Uncharacterized protein n=1 Tax=Acacia crassicarpa TaxID=499986 RepID=A0AAE1MQB9_9FABA|nr:hypothetical protein QN277_023097 [Acacia crassicarpa]
MIKTCSVLPLIVALLLGWSSAVLQFFAVAVFVTVTVVIQRDRSWDSRTHRSSDPEAHSAPSSFGPSINATQLHRPSARPRTREARTHRSSDPEALGGLGFSFSRLCRYSKPWLPLFLQVSFIFPRLPLFQTVASSVSELIKVVVSLIFCSNPATFLP